MPKNPDEKKIIIIAYIRNNPNATYRTIKKDTKLHLRRYFSNIKEAFQIAEVTPPRTFKRKTPEEKKRIIIEYIKKNPKAGGQTIRKETKINFFTIFKSIEAAFKEAGIEYPRKIDKRSKEEKKKELIAAIKNNPSITLNELTSKIRAKPYNFFKGMKEMYKKAGVSKIEVGEKRKDKKKKKVIEFIRNNSFATQREINTNCRTHVHDLFKEGIFDAYKGAGIDFPYERLKLHGTAIKEIRQRANDFEESIAMKLSGYGNVKRLVKTKRGFADIIFERKNKKAIIEVKNYEAKDISISQVNQLNKYLEDCNCNLGFLICIKKPQKDRFLIGKNKIFILEASEISKIPELIDGS